MKRKAFRSKGILTAAIVAAGLSVLGGTAFGSLCVWLKPDRDIKHFFPGGDSYITDVRVPNAGQQRVIEKRLGQSLDPDENEFKFFRVKKQGRVVGTVLTHQARGRYGAVQTVVAIGNDSKTIGAYVQRHREPANLNQPTFLKQFAGKLVADPIEVGKDIRPIAGADQSSQAVAYSVKKILVIYDVLNPHA